MLYLQNKNECEWIEIKDNNLIKSYQYALSLYREYLAKFYKVVIESLYDYHFLFVGNSMSYIIYLYDDNIYKIITNETYFHDGYMENDVDINNHIFFKHDKIKTKVFTHKKQKNDDYIDDYCHDIPRKKRNTLTPSNI